MTNFLLIILIASVWVNIWIALRIAKSIDKPDFSKEDATVRTATDQANATTDDVNTAQHNLPPQN